MKVAIVVIGIFFPLLVSCDKKENETSVDRLKDFSDLGGIARLAPGWRGEIIAQTDQSYVGFDVEIGDADNDGNNEILATGSPDSRLYLFEKGLNDWGTLLLTDNLASCYPCLGMGVKVVDLDRDGQNEILVGTGSIAFSKNLQRSRFYLFQMKGRRVIKNLAIQLRENPSRFSHGLASGDIDNDGIEEVFSSYCAGGEIIRYDVDENLSAIKGRKVHHLSGSGEGAIISDVDNDDKVELIVVNGFRTGEAKVEIFEFDKTGELITPPRIIIDGYDGKGSFEASIVVGDIDNSGNNELIVAWKKGEMINNATIIGYHIEDKAVPLYTFAYEDEDLDRGLLENAMIVADADNDGKNELIVSTVGDMTPLYSTASKGLGHLISFNLSASGKSQKKLLLNFHRDKAESSWIAVGDADNDGKNEIILTTGKGDWRKLGSSYVVLVEKE